MLISLAITDMLSGICLCIHQIGEAVPKLKKPTERTGFGFRVMVDVVTASVHISTMFHLCVITLDRYISVFWALNYKDIISDKVVKLSIAVIWVISGMVSFCQLIWLYRVFDGRLDYEDKYTLRNVEKWYSLMQVIFLVIIPTIVLAVMYFRMTKHVGMLLKSVPGNVMSSTQSNEFKAMKIFIMMYLNFLLFMFPYFICRLLIDFDANNKAIDRTLLYIFYYLKFFTPMINPILYALWKNDFRQAIRSLLRQHSAHSYNNKRISFDRRNETIGLPSTLRNSKTENESNSNSSLVDQPAANDQSNETGILLLIMKTRKKSGVEETERQAEFVKRDILSHAMMPGYEKC